MRPTPHIRISPGALKFVADGRRGELLHDLSAGLDSERLWEAILEVHDPHEPIHGIKDFLLHLLTISVGLLIAVGIEGCVERHREHVLVKDARATLREEIQANSSSIDNAVGTLDKNNAAMANNIDALTKVLRNPKDKDAQNANINADFSMISLKDTAWKTAQETGALAYMPYAQAQRYSDVYNMQRDFLSQQDKILEDESRFVGVMRRTDFGHGDITKEQAGEALERFGVWQAHLGYLVLMAKVTAADDKAFLEGKEGPRAMHWNLQGAK